MWKTQNYISVLEWTFMGTCVTMYNRSVHVQITVLVPYTEKAAVIVTLSNCNRKVFDSNLGQDDVYPD
jgi:hypothetical protein